MPIYEYKCDKCGKVTEVLQSSAKKKPKKCPHCGGTKLQKLLSTFSPMIKQGESKRCHSCTDMKCPHAGM